MEKRERERESEAYGGKARSVIDVQKDITGHPSSYSLSFSSLRL
jgi:hypothetical protein